MSETLSDPLKDALDIQENIEDHRIASAASNIVDLDSYRPASVSQAESQTAEPEQSKSKLNGTMVVAGVAAVAAAGAFGASVSGLQGGSEKGEEVGVTIEAPSTIELNEVANLRYDPKVEDGEFSNKALNLGEPITIDVNEDMRRLDDTNNGTWYGIPVEAVKEAVPDADLSKDKDGIVWVNQQGVSNVQTTTGISATEATEQK